MKIPTSYDYMRLALLFIFSMEGPATLPKIQKEFDAFGYGLTRNEVLEILNSLCVDDMAHTAAYGQGRKWMPGRRSKPWKKDGWK